MSDKPIILEIDNIRIRKWDSMNYLVERKEKYFNPKAKKEVEEYKFKGYYGSILAALRAISRKGLLIDESSVSDLNTYIQEVERSNQKVIDVMKSI